MATVREKRAVALLALLGTLTVWLVLRRVAHETAHPGGFARIAQHPPEEVERLDPASDPVVIPSERRIALQASESSTTIETGLDTTRRGQPVRVHGRVWHGGSPVEDVALGFVRSDDSTNDEVDWDFSDEDGSYNLQVPAARYRVVIDDGWACADEVEVEAGVEELGWDIHLSALTIDPGKAASNP